MRTKQQARLRTEDVIRVIGGKSILADLLEIERSAVSQWGEYIPELRRYQLKELRPTLEREIAALRRSRVS